MSDNIGGLDDLEELIGKAGSSASSDTILVSSGASRALAVEDQLADTIHLDDEDVRVDGGVDGGVDSDNDSDDEGDPDGSTIQLRRRGAMKVRSDDTVRLAHDDTVRVAGDGTIRLVYGDTVSAAQDRTQRASRQGGSAVDVSRSISVSTGFVAAKPTHKPVTDLSKLAFYPPEVLPGGIAPYPIREQPVLPAMPSWVDTAPDAHRVLDVGQVQRVAENLERRRRAWRYGAYATVGGSTVGGIIVLAIGIYLLIRG